MEALKQKYIALLLEHHEAISNSLFDTDQCQTIAHDIKLKKQDPIYMKQFRIPEAQREAVQKHVPYARALLSTEFKQVWGVRVLGWRFKFLCGGSFIIEVLGYTNKIGIGLRAWLPGDN
jgi:hypothetical protein